MLKALLQALKLLCQKEQQISALKAHIVKQDREIVALRQRLSLLELSNSIRKENRSYGNSPPV